MAHLNRSAKKMKMLLPMIMMDDRPSAWSVVFSWEHLLEAGMVSLLVVSVWIAVLMFSKKKGERLVLPYAFKCFLTATVALCVCAVVLVVRDQLR